MGTEHFRLSNYPGGFLHGLTIAGMPIQTTNPGKVFWVDENASRTGRGTFNSPDTSIDTCMSRCVAGRGDIIMVKPGHEENISAAAGLVCDIAGVAIVGTGRGDDQAKITFDTADTADIDVTAANVSFVNMWFYANYANVDGAIDVAAGGDYLTIQNCRVSAGSTALDFEEFINLAAGAHNFSFIGNDVELLEGTDGEALVLTAGDSDSMRVIGNNIVMESSTSIFDLDAAAITSNGPIFRDNFMVNLTAAADYCVEIQATTVAYFCNERYSCAGAAIPVNDGSASHFVNCQGCDGVNQSSLIFPKTATAWP